MNIYLGTYSGKIFHLSSFPSQLKYEKSVQISQSSIRSIIKIKQQILFSTYSNQLKIFNTQTSKEILDQKDNQGGKINVIKQLNQKHVILGIDNGSVKLFDLQSYSIIKQQRSHSKPILDIIFDQQKKLMITASKDKLCFWATKDFKKVYQYKLSFNVQGIHSTQDFSSLFLIGQRQIRQLSTADNTQMAKLQLKIQLGQIQTHLLFNDSLIIGTSTGQVLIWKKGQYQHFIKFKAHNSRIKVSTAVDIEQISYFITGSSEGQVKAWDVLQFVKQVQKISQDYNLQGLKPILETNLQQRLLCLAIDSKFNNTMKKIKKDANLKENQSQQQQKQQKEEQNQQNKNISKKKKNKDIQKHKIKSVNNQKRIQYLEKVKKIKKFKSQEKSKASNYNNKSIHQRNKDKKKKKLSHNTNK